MDALNTSHPSAMAFNAALPKRLAFNAITASGKNVTTLRMERRRSAFHRWMDVLGNCTDTCKAHIQRSMGLTHFHCLYKPLTTPRFILYHIPYFHSSFFFPHPV